MNNIEELIDDGGEIKIGAIGSIECVATAANGSNALAMLVRREGETLNALLKRLDRAIAKFYKDGEATRSTALPIDCCPVRVGRQDAHTASARPAASSPAAGSTPPPTPTAAPRR